jgi:Uma2 family endonuclease
MTDIAVNRSYPWTEEAYLSLSETLARIELVDGNLLVSAPPNVGHQVIRSHLLRAIHAPAEAAGLYALSTVNLRLGLCRIYNPDFVLVGPIDFEALVVDVSAVRLVGEIVSPLSASTDRILKRHHYAEAAIPWYLLVEQEPELMLRLLHVEDGHYVEHAVGRIGQPLRLTEPVTLDLDPAVLLPRH